MQKVSIDTGALMLPNRELIAERRRKRITSHRSNLLLKSTHIPLLTPLRYVFIDTSRRNDIPRGVFENPSLLFSDSGELPEGIHFVASAEWLSR